MVERTAADAPEDPRWDELSPRALGIVQRVEIPITLLGYSEREVAAWLGTNVGTVRRCRRELRRALGGE